MNRYRVMLTHALSETAYVEVEAATETEAERLALTDAVIATADFEEDDCSGVPVVVDTSQTELIG